MIQFLLDHWSVFLGLALFAVILVTSIPWSKLPSIPWPRSTGTTAQSQVVPPDADVIELQALKVVQARMIRLKCKEGQAHVTGLFDHFFHTEGHA